MALRSCCPKDWVGGVGPILVARVRFAVSKAWELALSVDRATSELNADDVSHMAALVGAQLPTSARTALAFGLGGGRLAGSEEPTNGAAGRVAFRWELARTPHLAFATEIEATSALYPRYRHSAWIVQPAVKLVLAAY